MRNLHQLLLALASLSTVVLSGDVSSAHSHGPEPAANEPPAGLGLSAKYPLPGPRCDTWVGIEMIFMVEIAEVCPDGSTVTETMTKCVETLTRSICATATTNRPCYPCIMGTPPISDTATVSRTSCSTATEETVTVTVQLCSTCTTTTYTGTVPGYTPGGPCYGCTPYGSGSPLGSGSVGGSGVSATTTTITSTSTRTVSASGGCVESDTTTSTPPGNPRLPSSTTSTSTTAATHTPYKPTTAAPPIVTGGSVQNGAADTAVLFMMGVMVCAILGV